MPGVILLVSGATVTVQRLAGHPNLGVLLTPRDGNRVPPAPVPFACDNAAFSGFDQPAFERMLARQTARRALFVVAPDVVGDAAATLELLDEWEIPIRRMGQPVAFVAQDGLTLETTPWERFNCLFIGGSTEFKLGYTVAQLVGVARSLGKWVHMGRVNTLRRLRYAHGLGCDSADGSKFSRFSETYVPGALDFLTGMNRLPLGGVKHE